MAEMKENLYEPYNPRLKHPGVLQNSFYYNSIHISLRPFLIPEDFILYNSWIGAEVFTNRSPVKNGQLISEEYFDAIALSSGSQCICGLVNAEPTFVAELYPCSIHCPADLVQVINPQPGDVLFQLLIAPHVLVDRLICEYILHACLTHLSGFNELKRAFWIMDTHDHYSRVSARTGTHLHFAEGKEVYKYELSLYQR